jgi:hypothetical protein
MSVVMGDAESNAIKLAKVMKDPIANMNVLNRSSGGFTNTQKEQAIAIEATNGKFAAQDYLLGILEDTFKSLAEKTADPMARINKQFEDMAQAVALEAIPAIEILAEKIVEWVKGPKGQAAIKLMTDAMGDFVDYITSPEGQKAMDKWIDKFVIVAEWVGKIITGLADIIKMLDDIDKKGPYGGFEGFTPGGGRIPVDNRPGRGGGGGGLGTSPFGGTSRGLTVNFNTPVDSVSAGREIARVLDNYNRSNGNRR